MKKQLKVKKDEFERVELMLKAHVEDIINILMSSREVIRERTILLSEEASAMVVSNALYHFLKSMCFHDTNYNEDEGVTQLNISDYEDFADEIICKAFFEMCEKLGNWRPSRNASQRVS